MSFLSRGKYLGKCQIKDGAIVGQDHHWAEWRHDSNDPLFDAYEFLENEAVLEAPGYGQLPGTKYYGNGCLYVKHQDIQFVEIVGAMK